MIDHFWDCCIFVHFMWNSVFSEPLLYLLVHLWCLVQILGSNLLSIHQKNQTSRQTLSWKVILSEDLWAKYLIPLSVRLCRIVFFLPCSVTIFTSSSFLYFIYGDQNFSYMKRLPKPMPPRSLWGFQSTEKVADLVLPILFVHIPQDMFIQKF